MGRVTKISSAAVLGLAVMASAQPITAQETSIERATQLEAKAQSLLADMEDWGDAGKLLREAAMARPDGDPQAIQDLRQAAKLAYYTGEEKQAMRQLEALGSRALNEGDVLTAATSFAEAAWIAAHEGEGAKALELSERAQKLSHSPLLAAADRRSIRDRFVSGPSGG